MAASAPAPRGPGRTSVALALCLAVLLAAAGATVASNSSRGSRERSPRDAPLFRTQTMQFGPRKHCEDVKASTTVMYMYHYDGAGKLFLVPDAAAAAAAAADGPAAASEEERPEVARDACAGFSTGRLQVLSFDARRYAGSAEVTYTHRDVSPSESSPRRGSFTFALDREQVFRTSTRFEAAGAHVMEVQVTAKLMIRSGAAPAPPAVPAPPAEDGRSCPCTRELNLVCGTDGKQYNNPCLARCAHVGVRSVGSCAEPREVEDPSSCVCPAVYRPVCGADSVTYSNSCEARCNGVNYASGACESTERRR